MPTSIDEKKLYLRINVEGYVPFYGGTEPIEVARATARAFFGLCAALRIASMTPRRFGTALKRRLLAYEPDDKKWAFFSEFDFSPETSQAIAGLTVLDSVREPLGTVLVATALRTIRAIFERQGESALIRRAAQWHFDSLGSANRLLAFFQSMVALEALLGDKAESDKVGVGDLLANRLAYLIAKNLKERDEILTDFRRIYDTRSHIVHRGKDRLTLEEARLLARLDWYCTRVIQAEAKLLEALPNP